MSKMSDLLEQYRPEDMSNRGIADKVGVSPGTIDALYNGTHGRLKEPTLKLLSDKLNIPIGKLRAANTAPTGEQAPWKPPPEADQLNRRQRKAIDELIRSVVQSSDDAQTRLERAAAPAVRIKQPKHGDQKRA